MRTNISEYYLATVSIQPTARCLQSPDNEQTYEQVFRKSFAISKKLSTYRLVPVVVLLPKSVSAVNCIIGTTLSGNIYVPVDISAPVERIEKIISSLGECIVLYDGLTENIFGSIPEELYIQSINVDDIVANERFTIVEMILEVRSQIQDLIDTDPAYIIFTSGSTGTPKGVTVSHRSIIDYIDWANSIYQIDNTDIIGSQAPFYFDNSTLDLYLTFSNGSCLNLIPESIFIFPIKILEYLNTFKISAIFWVPSLLVNIANLQLLEKIKLDDLKYVLFAGEVMPARQLKYWLKHHPKALYSNLYGPTEITVDCTYFNVPVDWDGDDLPIGVPCKNTSILILDENDKLSENGELCVRGSSLALGYWGDSEKSKKVFVQNPLNIYYRDLIYRTGDLVRLENGLIYFVGRKDSQIKHNGYRIELGEIESVVSNLECVGTSIAGYIAEEKTLFLCVVPVTSITINDFRKLLLSILPRYMMPSKIVFFDDFPMTPNGKINRLKLRELITEGL